MPRFEMPPLQTAVFQMVITVASGHSSFMLLKLHPFTILGFESKAGPKFISASQFSMFELELTFWRVEPKWSSCEPSQARNILT